MRWSATLAVGDFNPDPGVVPCLTNGISAGRLVRLALAYSVGSCVEPDMTCELKLDWCAASRRDSVGACRNALAASSSCRVLADRWFSPHILFFLSSMCGGGFLPKAT